MTRPTQKAADPSPHARRPVRPALRLSLQFVDARHRGTIARAGVTRWIRAALAVPAEITVRIVDSDEGLVLNRDFRGQDHATNVLTFPYDDAPVLGADLVLCAPVVEAEAEAQKPIEDRKYSRGSLLSALRDTVADKGIAALSKRIPPNIGG